VTGRESNDAAFELQGMDYIRPHPGPLPQERENRSPLL